MERAASISGRMSNRAKRREALLQQREVAQKNRETARKRLWLAGIVFICVSAILAMVIFNTTRREQLTQIEATVPSAPAEPIPANATDSPTDPADPRLTNPGFPTLWDLLAMNPNQLAKVDIAVVNLRCAEWMPGAEKIDIASELHKLDIIAAWVKHETEEYSYQLDQHPELYHGVKGKYEMDMLATVLQEDYHMHYDPAQAAIEADGKMGTPEDTFVHDARNLFINGVIDRAMGTCANMPVFEAAIARRLGYPVYLAEASNHLYLQWIDGSTKFNIEATSPGGLNEHPDDFYRHWPHEVSPQDAEKFYYFKPLSPRDELALFLSNRTSMLLYQGEWMPAMRCQAKAVELAEHKGDLNLYLDWIENTWRKNQMEEARALPDQRGFIQVFHPQGELSSRPINIPLIPTLSTNP